MVNIKDLEYQSQLLYKDGLDLLEQKGLRSILSSYGEFSIIGSFDLNLLIKPDLDLYVKIPDYNIRKHFDVFTQIAETIHPLRMKYLDLREANWPEFPIKEGLFIGLSVVLNGKEWSIDGWALAPEVYEERVSYHKQIKQLLTNSMRTILWGVKSQIYNSKDYRSGDLYEAVLKDGVTTTEGYYLWYKEKNQKDFAESSPN